MHPRHLTVHQGQRLRLHLAAHGGAVALDLQQEGVDALRVAPTIVIGWSTIEGWAISPSDLSQHAHGLSGFMPDEPLICQTFYLPRVVSDLRHSRAILAIQADHEKFHQGPEDRLMSPAGKVLANLKTTGSVSLDAYLGQQVGVQGTRFSEKEKRDIIEVSALENVQLRQ